MSLMEFIANIIPFGLTIIIVFLWLGYWIFYQDKATELTNRIFNWVLFIVSFLGCILLRYLFSSLCVGELPSGKTFSPLLLESLAGLLSFLSLLILSLILAIKNFIYEIKEESSLGKWIRITLIVIMSYFIVNIIYLAIISYFKC